MSLLSKCLGSTATALALALASGCVHYESKPISAIQTASDWQNRSLADAGLRAFCETNLGQRAERWPPENWDLRRLTLAAFYYHPDLDMAGAKWSVANESLTNPLLIVAVLPLGIIGAIAALWLTRTPLSTTVFIGLILLVGIAANNAIVLVLLQFGLCQPKPTKNLAAG